jgi:hypothetical protein
VTQFPTAREYLDVHRVDVCCNACDHMRRLDLAWLVGGGFGDVPLVELPLRCTACGAKGHNVIVSGQSYGYSC